jgi:tripartite-type tricarboxylate transporter receptor subunit TctC
VHNVREFLTYARRNPGVQFGTAGTGTSMHLAGTMFAQMANVHLVHVPYKGSAPGITDLIAGHLPAMFDNLPASLPHIQSGKLKALAVAGRQRSPSLPDVPTMAEAGLAGYEVDPWFGVYGPAGMDPRVVHALNEALVEALNLPAIRDKLEKAGFTPQSSTPQALEKLTQSEYVRLGKVANAAQMTAD